MKTRLFFALAIGLAGALLFVNQESLSSAIIEFTASRSLFESMLVLGAVVCVGTVLLIPASVLFALSGAVLGITAGFFAGLLGFTLGATIAFFIGRYLANDLVQQWGSRYLIRVNQFASDRGWRFIALIRLIPIAPAFVINYLLGLTHISSYHYTVGSALFIAPNCLFMTYLGYATQSLLSSSPSEHEKLRMLFISASALICLALLLWVFRSAVVGKLINARRADRVEDKG